jgi:hypothetical protein
MPILSNVESNINNFYANSNSVVIRDSGTNNLGDRNMNKNLQHGYSSVADVHLQIAVLPKTNAVLHSVLPDRLKNRLFLK